MIAMPSPTLSQWLATVDARKYWRTKISGHYGTLTCYIINGYHVLCVEEANSAHFELYCQTAPPSAAPQQQFTAVEEYCHLRRRR